MANAPRVSRADIHPIPGYRDALGARGALGGRTDEAPEFGLRHDDPLLKRMEKRELALRTRNPKDERTVIVTLAPKGQARVEVTFYR